ncbi:Rv3235 family protein [Mycetocola spongiae]|uniref:Rv3235 family protein n=1 Tax=Mycetocola spongiae TaxID=2859226 RepID=UPI001CF0F1CD|nr:Rv3235 family protein [Mycetocola spongiae]UCR90300.1 3-hydroxyacyl-CoA dehydrogenase [Mycetocola spongiae]
MATPPIPEPSGETICALCASLLEVLGGARPVEQLARWIAEPVFNRLRIRVTLAARGRQLRGTEIPVPAYRFGPVHRCSPAPGVVEAAVVVRDRVRARAIAIRFEGTQARWLATAIHVL